MSAAKRPSDWGTTLSAAVFAGCFFAAIPGYFLHSVDGPASFDCRPGPWRCAVRRWVGYERIRLEASADRVRVATRSSSFRGRTSREYRIVFEHAREGVVPVSGWVTNDPGAVVRALEDARRRDAPVSAHLGSTFYFGMIALTALFFACGAAIPLATDLGGRRAPRGPRAR